MTTARMIWRQEYSKARRLNRAFPAKVDPVRFAEFVLRMGFGPVFGQLFPATFSRAAAASAAPWWYVAGKTCVAAYQPKGAASLAASYVNLANPGTYDAAPGTAPDWDSGTGWTFNGSTQYLMMTSPISGTGARSIIARFTPNANADQKIVALGNSSLGNFKDFSFTTEYAVRIQAANAIWSVSDTTNQVAAVVAPASGSTDDIVAYRNGVAISRTSVVDGAYDTSGGAFIGVFVGSGGTRGSYLNGTIQAVAIYNTTLSAAQVAAVSAAMAAL